MHLNIKHRFNIWRKHFHCYIFDYSSINQIFNDSETNPRQSNETKAVKVSVPIIFWGLIVFCNRFYNCLHVIVWYVVRIHRCYINVTRVIKTTKTSVPQELSVFSWRSSQSEAPPLNFTFRQSKYLHACLCEFLRFKFILFSLK